MRTRRTAAGVLAATGAALGVAVVGGGMTYASQLLPAPIRDRTLDLTATLTSRGTVVLPPVRQACLEQFGLLLDEAFLRYGGEVIGTCDGVGTVERTVLDIQGGDPPLDVAQPARFDEYIYSRGPAEVGLTSEDVVVRTDVGPAEAWYLPGARDTWVLLVHGRSGTRHESLRILPTIVEAGFPALVITYRNDFVGGPPGTDRTGRFGQAEWPDLAAAVAHARERGAADVVLVGFSQGGSLIGYLLREVGDAGVAGIILDSPLLDLPATLVQQARRRGLPRPLVPPILLGTRLEAMRRSGFDVTDVRHVETFAGTDVPTLLIHGVADDFVPIGPSDQVAAARRSGLTYLRVEGAGHVEAYNAGQARYSEAVRGFLESL